MGATSNSATNAPEREIECFRCGECCRRYQARLTPIEAHRIADALGISPNEFIKKYTDPRWGSSHSFLLRSEKSACVFLENTEGKQNLCQIHPVRPVSCREWTASLNRKECREGLTKYWKLTVSPEGKLESTEEDLRRFQSFTESLGNPEPTSKILHIENAVECRIVERLNRFVVKVELDGSYHRACTNNTGRLHQFLINGKTGFCTRNEKPGKTEYRLFGIRDNGLGAIIDTRLQMQAFERAVEMELIPWLKDSEIQKRNARLGDSLIDYLLESNGKETYLEVKSAVLREDHFAMYPDCPTERGRRHIRELTDYVRKGGEAIILFIAALPDVTAFKPDQSADPELSRLLKEAQKAGVNLKSIGMVYQPEDSFIYLSNLDLRVCI